MKRSGRKSAAQTPAPKGERIFGSSKNPKGSAKSKISGKSIELSEKVENVLKEKVSKHNEKYPSKKVTLAALKSVFRRGAGAYSSSHRPTITGGFPNSRNAWAFARVNKFLEKKMGKQVKKAYVQDDDLLEKGGELKKPHNVIAIAKKHKVSVSVIMKGLREGMKVEMEEHTKDKKTARTIALHHLWESPKYYDKLEKMEKSFKDGGEVAHISGKAGGVLVGRRHSEGGIKAVNKSNDQPLEMEGGEVVITRNAVSDEKKREFEGEMLTNKEILSRINQSGGGVAFADGGEVEPKCACKGNKYKWGGKMMSDFDIVNDINKSYSVPQKLAKRAVNMAHVKYADLKPSEAMRKIYDRQHYKSGGIMEQFEDSVFYITKNIPTLKGFVKSMKSVKSPFDDDNALYKPIRKAYHVAFYRNGDEKADKITQEEAYKTFLFDEYGIRFKDLPSKIRNAFILGNQQLIDSYINK